MTLPSASRKQPLADHPALHLVALGAGKRGIVDAEGHGQGGRIDRLGRQRLGNLGRAERVRNERLGQARYGDDVAGETFIDRRAFQAAKGKDLGHPALFDQAAVTIEHFDRLIRLHRTRRNASGHDAAEIGIGLQDRSQHAERALLDHRRRHVANDEVEQRRHAPILGAGRIGRHPALPGRTVKNGKVELFLARLERGEQIEDLIGDFRGAGVRPIDLVDDDDWLQSHFERLGDHELGLRQRALGGVHQHQRAVHHVEDALDLAAEIGVAGRIDDIDSGAPPKDRGHLRQDGDTPLALEVVRIERALGDPLILAKSPRLLEQAVDQRGFAMIHMGDDGNVAEFHGDIVKSLRAPKGPARCGI